MAEATLVTRDLVKSFGEVQVLKSVNAQMEHGDFLVLVGPSGCGKSTLLNCIAGLEEVTSGTISIAGRDVTQVPPRDRDIAMVFQSYALYPTMTVAQNIGFGMKIRKLDRAIIDEKVRQVAAMLQIEHLLDRRPSQLSGGQRQRVAMGRALVREPTLFLFDEPLSNLDAKLRVEMRAEIKRLHETTGASMVYVTHDQIEAMTLATKIIVLKDGVVQQAGSPADIYHKPANTFVAGFMGSPPMNIVPARTEARGDDLIVQFDGAAPNALALGSKKAIAQREFLVGFRPEDVSMASDGAGRFERPLPVISTEHTGSDTFVRVKLGDEDCTVRLPGHMAADVGDTIPLALDRTLISFFDRQNQTRAETDLGAR